MSVLVIAGHIVIWRATFEVCIIMNSHRQIAFAAYGDPFDPSTWSGTSANLAAAMTQIGIDVIGLNCRPTQKKWRSNVVVDRLMGHHAGYTVRRLGRQKCSELVRNLPSECVGVLHMSSLTVPTVESTPGRRHFLLCDAMNDFWRRYATGDQSTYRRRRNEEADERAAVDATDLFFPISQHNGANLRDHYGVAPARITVVGTGRGKIEPLQGTKDYSRKNILMVAKQRFLDKGGPLLIEAIQIARQVDPQVHLTLVSPEEFRPFVQGVEGVTLTGTVEWSELQRLFDTSCLYAMPALCEPWGLVYAEALATKTPILGLDRASLPELTRGGQYGFLVKEPTPKAVADALLDAVSDPLRLQQMGEAGQNYCLETFSWQRTATLVAQAIWPS